METTNVSNHILKWAAQVLQNCRYCWSDLSPQTRPDLIVPIASKINLLLSTITNMRNISTQQYNILDSDTSRKCNIVIRSSVRHLETRVPQAHGYPSGHCKRRSAEYRGHLVLLGEWLGEWQIVDISNSQICYAYQKCYYLLFGG